MIDSYNNINSSDWNNNNILILTIIFFTFYQIRTLIHLYSSVMVNLAGYYYSTELNPQLDSVNIPRKSPCYVQSICQILYFENKVTMSFL